MKEAGKIKPGVAIPTEYAGLTFRSRLEADAAALLDAFDIYWEYESRSFLLPSGKHFCPDFWCPDIATFLETRGYQEHSDCVEFGGLIDRLEIEVYDYPTTFVQLGPERSRLWQSALSDRICEAVGMPIWAPGSSTIPHLYKCEVCGRANSFSGFGYDCSRCLKASLGDFPGHLDEYCSWRLLFDRGIWLQCFRRGYDAEPAIPCKEFLEAMAK